MRRVLAALMCAFIAVVIPTATPAYADPGPGAAEACSAGPTCIDVQIGLDRAEIGPGELGKLQLTITITGGDLTSGTLRTRLDPVLTADGSTASVADPGAVQQDGNDVAIDLVTAGLITAGTYEITMDVALTPDGGAEPGLSYSSWAQADVEAVDDPGANLRATSEDMVVAVAPVYANVSLYSFSDVETPISKSGLEYVSFGLNGDDSTPSRLTFTLPTGLAIGSAGITTLLGSPPPTCALVSGSTYSCQIPAGFDDSLSVYLQSTPSAVIGTSTAVTFTIAPVGAVDMNSTDNSVKVRIRIVGLSQYVQSISPASQSRRDSIAVPVGTPTTFTVTVTNPGPDPATGVRIRAFLYDSRVGVAWDANPYQNADLKVTGLGQHLFSSIPVGGSVQFTVSVTGVRPGSTYIIGTGGTAESTRQGLQCVDGSCFSASLTRFTLVDAPPPVASASPGATLANTGVEIGGLRTSGIALLAVGLMLSWAGRRPDVSLPR